VRCAIREEEEKNCINIGKKRQHHYLQMMTQDGIYESMTERTMVPKSVNWQESQCFSAFCTSNHQTNASFRSHAWWCTSIISELGRQRQEEHEF
jgi:hypothetical protein